MGSQLLSQDLKMISPEVSMEIPVMKMIKRMTKMETHEDVTAESSSSLCRDMMRDNGTFTFRNQVLDNMFWSISWFMFFTFKLDLLNLI